MTRFYASCFCLVFLALACSGGDSNPPDAEPPEILFPEPPGAPTATADGRLTCLGNNQPPAPAGNAVELTGYVRTLADPAATMLVPAAQVEAFSPTGTSIGAGFADPTKAGRIAVSVPITQEGFVGSVLVTQAGYLDWSFQTNRAVTLPQTDGWTWLASQAEVDQWALDLGVTLDAGRGLVVGSVHDCDNFGVGFAVVQVNGETSGVSYVSAFTPAPADTYTSASGRFVVPNLVPGPATVKAFARLVPGGPLTLISSVQTEVVAGRIAAVGLQLR